MPKQDAKLVDLGNYYDIQIDSDGDIETEDSFDAILITSLFVDKRADESEIAVSENRRGWIGNLGYSYQIGSKLWLYYQSRANALTAQAITVEVKSALKFLVDDGYVKDVNVTSQAINGGISFTVDIYRFDGNIDTKYYTLWNNTGK